MKTNRIGKFELDVTYIRKEPEFIAKVFAVMEFIPVRAEFMYATNKIHYEGYSCLFDEIPECQVTPTYSINMGDGINMFSVEAVPLD